jgi:protein-L-isoaspartate(D-aspartate) O-methyltransferase
MWQFGAHGFGPGGDRLGGDLLDLIAVWDDHYRHGPAPQITLHPTGTPPPVHDRLQLLAARRHTTIAVTWPTPVEPQ